MLAKSEDVYEILGNGEVFQGFTEASLRIPLSPPSLWGIPHGVDICTFGNPSLSSMILAQMDQIRICSKYLLHPAPVLIRSKGSEARVSPIYESVLPSPTASTTQRG